MADLGRYNQLKVLYSTPHGIYLDGGDHGEILLPTRYIPRGTQLDDVIEVFVYRDSEDRVIATTERPFAQAGEFASLEVVGVHRQVGVFLNWGLPKDLLLPYRELTEKVDVGQKVAVYIILDERSDRIIATTRLNRHLSRQPAPYKKGQEVGLLITNRTPLGYNVLVEKTHIALLHAAMGATALQPGQEMRGFISAVHPDGKLDVSLDASGYQRVAPLTERILEALKANGGSLPFDDDSPADRVRENFGSSKTAFKQALGALFRQRKIRFTRPGIQWVDVNEPTSSDWRPS
ncbi:MAG: S1-like domain-containing RNA-binding protein [Verrucomicrobia bacterium]|nr:S1-like domain-containing RNA-binding protein [Verrucomicrobiota bacterium]